MAEFKVGEMVGRITECNEDSDGRVIKVGDVLEVKALDGRGWLLFDNFSGASDPKFFVPTCPIFRVGDKVVRSVGYRGRDADGMHYPYDDKVMTVKALRQGHVILEGDNYSGGWMEEKFELAPTVPVVEHTSRANDPATSKAAGKIKRISLREKVWVAMTATAYGGDGRTGHELAKVVGAPLNSVTPRLAELRRADKIKDSGQRRDKQIVWVLV
jgi:hypothetical protein